MLYFDHCATTPPYDEVIDVISQVMRQYYGNPSSIHKWGVEAEGLLTKAREVIARSLKVKQEHIVFTSGGTESNNLAIKGIMQKYKSRGKHLITSKIEHASVLECFRQLEALGYRTTYLPVDETGSVSVEDVHNAICADTVLVSVMHVNNEMGRIQPIDQIGHLLRSHPRIFFHVDAVQSVGKLRLDPQKSGIDLMSLSAHKFRGPKGTGILYKREGVGLEPLIVGGGQEFGLRSGTENVPLIVAMAKALRMTVEKQEEHSKRLYSLQNRLTDRIKNIPELVLNGSTIQSDMAPHIVNFSFPGMRAEVLVHTLEKYQIYVSTKSACSSGEGRPSRVLEAMGLDPKRSASGIRISLAPDHKDADIDFLGDKLQMAVNELKTMMR